MINDITNLPGISTTKGSPTFGAVLTISFKTIFSFIWPYKRSRYSCLPILFLFPPLISSKTRSWFSFPVLTVATMAGANFWYNVTWSLLTFTDLATTEIKSSFKPSKSCWRISSIAMNTWMPDSLTKYEESRLKKTMNIKISIKYQKLKNWWRTNLRIDMFTYQDPAQLSALPWHQDGFHQFRRSVHLS